MAHLFSLRFFKHVDRRNCILPAHTNMLPVLFKTLAAVTILIGSVQIANANDIPQSGNVFQPSIDALIKLFVAALLLESGLSVLFNWRVYLTLLDGRGWKTIIMVGASWLLVKAVNINWLDDLFKSYGSGVVSNDSTQILTALILAGGSNGIYNILLKLGYRAPVATEAAQPTPPPDKARISIAVQRDKASGAIGVHLDRIDPAPNPLPLAIAGVVGAGDLKTEIAGCFFAIVCVSLKAAAIQSILA